MCSDLLLAGSAVQTEAVPLTQQLGRDVFKLSTRKPHPPPAAPQTMLSVLQRGNHASGGIPCFPLGQHRVCSKEKSPSGTAQKLKDILFTRTDLLLCLTKKSENYLTSSILICIMALLQPCIKHSPVCTRELSGQSETFPQTTVVSCDVPRHRMCSVNKRKENGEKAQQEESKALLVFQKMMTLS